MHLTAVNTVTVTDTGLHVPKEFHVRVASLTQSTIHCTTTKKKPSTSSKNNFRQEHCEKHANCFSRFFPQKRTKKIKQGQSRNLQTLYFQNLGFIKKFKQFLASKMTF